MIAWKIAGVAVIATTSLLVVAMWAMTGGVSALESVEDILVSAGRLTGLVAANLFLYQVVLLARVPLFERAFGHDVLVRSHRVLGIASAGLLLTHMVMIGAGRVSGAVGGQGEPGSLAGRGLDGPFAGAAAAGIAVLLLIAVMVTSGHLRGKLRYEAWHRFHSLAYVAVALALPHQFLAGTTFTSSAVATAYWWGLWGLAAAAIVTFRVILPRVRSARSRLQVNRVMPDGDRGVTVEMGGRELDRLKTKAGQFFVWRFKTDRGWTSGNPFSISAAPTPGRLQITARIVGDGTQRLVTMAPGTRVRIEGPYGHMVGERRRATKLLMLGAGAGVAPLVSLLEEQTYAPGEAVLVTRDNRPGEQMRVDAIDALVNERGLRHVALVGDLARHGSRWLPSGYGVPGAKVLRALAPDVEAFDIFVCGPKVWMQAVMADLADLGVNPGQIHSEDF